MILRSVFTGTFFGMAVFGSRVDFAANVDPSFRAAQVNPLLVQRRDFSCRIPGLQPRNELILASARRGAIDSDLRTAKDLRTTHCCLRAIRFAPTLLLPTNLRQ